jgi:hypothetical protein
MLADRARLARERSASFKPVGILVREVQLQFGFLIGTCRHRLSTPPLNQRECPNVQSARGYSAEPPSARRG